MISFHQISLSTFVRNFALNCNVKKFKKFEQFPKFSKQNFQKQQGYYQQHKCYFKTGTKFLQRFVQKISSPQTNKVTNILTYQHTNILTNEHPDIMLILSFLDSPDPKTGKSAKKRKWKKNKYLYNYQSSLTQCDGELKGSCLLLQSILSYCSSSYFNKYFQNDPKLVQFIQFHLSMFPNGNEVSMQYLPPGECKRILLIYVICTVFILKLFSNSP